MAPARSMRVAAGAPAPMASGRVVALVLLVASLVAGCGLGRGGKGLTRHGDESSSLSLMDIGEQALDTGVRLEEQGLLQGALEAYERAVWAFSYHERLTGRAPLLGEDARARLAALRKTVFPADSPK